MTKGERRVNALESLIVRWRNLIYPQPEITREAFKILRKRALQRKKASRNPTPRKRRAARRTR